VRYKYANRPNPLNSPDILGEKNLVPSPCKGYGVHTSVYKTKVVVDPPKSSDKLEDFERSLSPFLRGLGRSKACGETLEDLCVHRSLKGERNGSKVKIVLHACREPLYVKVITPLHRLLKSKFNLTKLERISNMPAIIKLVIN
jgi:hypothetical protein